MNSQIETLRALFLSGGTVDVICVLRSGVVNRMLAIAPANVRHTTARHPSSGLLACAVLLFLVVVVLFVFPQQANKQASECKGLFLLVVVVLVVVVVVVVLFPALCVPHF